jgi:hypothetical protein
MPNLDYIFIETDNGIIVIEMKTEDEIIKELYQKLYNFNL